MAYFRQYLTRIRDHNPSQVDQTRSSIECSNNSISLRYQVRYQRCRKLYCRSANIVRAMRSSTPLWSISQQDCSFSSSLPGNIRVKYPFSTIKSRGVDNHSKLTLVAQTQVLPAPPSLSSVTTQRTIIQTNQRNKWARKVVVEQLAKHNSQWWCLRHLSNHVVIQKQQPFLRTYSHLATKIHSK